MDEVVGVGVGVGVGVDVGACPVGGWVVFVKTGC